MIDKQDFYHGTVLSRLIEDRRCRYISKKDDLYIVNNTSYIYLKYSTKSRSPWTFTFKRIEIEKIERISDRITIALICGGDGICAIRLSELKRIFNNNVGCISVKRNFHKQYGVSGPIDKLDDKISLSRINELVFVE